VGIRVAAGGLQQLRQYLYFCTSTASKLSTCGRGAARRCGACSVCTATELSTRNGAATELSTRNGAATELSTRNGAATELSTRNGAATELSTRNGDGVGSGLALARAPLQAGGCGAVLQLALFADGDIIWRLCIALSG
jgi:hypothetical protein